MLQSFAFMYRGASLRPEIRGQRSPVVVSCWRVQSLFVTASCWGVWSLSLAVSCRPERASGCLSSRYGEVASCWRVSTSMGSGSERQRAR
ncbi:hypothetical protein FKM82_025186 [Ascaphus truei]